MILMIPSLSKRIAPVNCSRHSSTSRSTSLISLISPSSIAPRSAISVLDRADYRIEAVGGRQSAVDSGPPPYHAFPCLPPTAYRQPIGAAPPTTPALLSARGH